MTLFLSLFFISKLYFLFRVCIWFFLKSAYILFSSWWWILSFPLSWHANDLKSLSDCFIYSFPGVFSHICCICPLSWWRVLCDPNNFCLNSSPPALNRNQKHSLDYGSLPMVYFCIHLSLRSMIFTGLCSRPVLYTSFYLRFPYHPGTTK